MNASDAGAIEGLGAGVGVGPTAETMTSIVNVPPAALVNVTLQVPGAVAVSVNAAPDEPLNVAMDPVPHVVVAVAGASAAATESVSDTPTSKASRPNASIAFGDPVTDSAGAPIGATGTLVPLPEQPAMLNDNEVIATIATAKKR